MTREEIGRQIVNWEARRDGQGRIRVYSLPANDGGGTYEVAGINDRYHPSIAGRLRMLINAGRHAEAEVEAVEYILRYTDTTAKIAGNWRTELFLRDTAFNRGPGGAARILQHALKVPEDGAIGPVTRRALSEAEKDTPALIKRLREAREWYERAKAGYRANLWPGLMSRWAKVTAAALG